MLCKECQQANDEGYCADGCYPYYGLAPHNHDLTLGRSFIGSTVFDDGPLPDNFEPDPDDPSKTTGTWYCPNKGCENARPKMED